MEISNEKAIDLLKKLADEKGSQAKAARSLKISPAYFSDMVTGKRAISNQVAKKLGYKRVPAFEQIQGN